MIKFQGNFFLLTVRLVPEDDVTVAFGMGVVVGAKVEDGSGPHIRFLPQISDWMDCKEADICNKFIQNL